MATSADDCNQVTLLDKIEKRESIGELLNDDRFMIEFRACLAAEFTEVPGNKESRSNFVDSQPSKLNIFNVLYNG